MEPDIFSWMWYSGEREREREREKLKFQIKHLIFKVSLSYNVVNRKHYNLVKV